MKKTLFISLLLALSINIIAQNDNKYTTEWAKIEQFDKEKLPKSALKVIDRILQDAIKNNNNQQVIRALIERSKFNADIDSENNKAIFNDLQDLASKTTNVAEKSLLNSMLAELYLDYLENNSWTIKKRTALIDLVPDDIDEWSMNIFEDKIIDNLNSSIQNIEELKKITTQEFDVIIQIDKDGQTYYPTLYDFLMNRAINLSQNLLNITSNNTINFTSLGVTPGELVIPASEYIKLNINISASKSYRVFTYYQQFYKELIERNLVPTIILTELYKLNLVSRYSNTIQKDKKSILENLYNKYQSSPASVEIINTIVDATDSNKEKYEWCEKGIKEYPNYFRINILKQSLENLEHPYLELSGSGMFYPDSTIILSLRYKNLQALKKTVELKLYSVNLADKATYLKSFDLNLSSTKAYQVDTTNYNFGKLNPGNYKLSYVEDKGTKKEVIYDYNFHVTQFGVYSRTKDNNSSEIIVVDNATGKPLEGVTVKIYPYQLINKKWQYATSPISLKTDKSGTAIYVASTNKNDNKDYKSIFGRFTLSKDSDINFGYFNLGKEYRYSYNQRSKKEDTPKKITNIFIDRNIYRPGQIVYYKAILTLGDSLRINETVTAKLLNANREVITEKELRSDKFGSVSGEFIIPKSGLNGYYNITIDNSYKGFSVEEYKRPTFEITFDKLKGTYSLGEEITIKGSVKNFSGVSLQNTDVSFNISRNQYSFWRYGNPTELENGIVKTNNDGTFEITFIPKGSDNFSSYPYPIVRYQQNDESTNEIYTFTIDATVTDLNGETQSNSFSTTIGNVSMLLNINLPDKVEKTDNSTIKIEAMNLNQQNVETSGSYTIYAVDSDDKNLKEVATGNFAQTGIQPELRDDINKLASGKYRITLKAIDDKKNMVKSSKVFILYSFDDRKPPIASNNWIVVKNDTIAKDRSAEIIYGVTDKDVYLLYQVYDNTKVYDRQFIKLSEENKKFIIPYKDNYKDQVNVTFTLVRNNVFTSENIVLQKARPNTQSANLDIKLAVFRDMLRPGEEENWTISVKDGKGNPVNAELLASMYDISIDKLHPTEAWSFRKQSKTIEYQYPFSYNYLDYNFAADVDCSIYFPLINNWKVEAIKLDRINWFGYTLNSHYRDNIFRAVKPASSYRLKKESITEEKNKAINGSETLSSNTPLSQSHLGSVYEAVPPVPENVSVPQIRQNFNETAFFYPQLRTNENGEIAISFKVPDSNTTWNFRAFAYDKSLQTGSLDQLVVSRKELMITPNLPRFVRVGDKTSISTKISNLSEHDMSGNVKIEFFDPSTDNVIDLQIANQTQSFYVKSTSSAQVTWTFDIPVGLDMIGCRIIADNGSFSDGEQHVLAVLPNRILVTETMPFDPIKGNDNTFIFDNLYNNKSKSLSDYRLTLEFASNPAWYAIQALPTLSNPTNENTVNWFASYYANSLGASIMKQYPRVANIITNWKNKSGNKEMLISKLQSNEELKTILLEETPWVMNAKDETEQMQRLSLLFDLNNNNQVTTTALNKLKELQTGEGGWSWFRGMETSRSITQYILYGFAQLQRTGKIEYNQDVKTMQISALQYIDSKILEDYTNLKKSNKDWDMLNYIYISQLEYLYVRSFYRDIPIDVNTREAERFYTNVASDNWKRLDLYQQSLLAVILYRNGDKTQANTIMKSIREHAVTDAKIGMYWPNNRSNAFMSMNTIVCHTFLMNAFQEIGTSDLEMDNLKRWLIAQKRTEQWGSCQATVDAINTILSTGSDWFVNDLKSPQITVGNTILDSTKMGASGTGYFITSWDKSEITDQLGKVVVTNVSDQPSYGSMYWQYYEDLDKIKKTSGDKSMLQVDKQLFKEVDINNSQSLVSINENNPLNIGDKVIVRLVINAGQDMNFVQLKDMRASCFEPLDIISGLHWQNKLRFYQTTEDASSNFFFDRIPKGTYVLEYPVYVTRTGVYANGITTIQCAYAPEYTSQTTGINVIVEPK